MTSRPPTRASNRYPAEFDCDALLADGSVGRIRPIRPDDADALSFFHEHLSGETIYRRFFGAHPHLLDEELRRFTQVDYRDRMALVAEVDGRLVAVARYDRAPGTATAEVAFVVADVLQGHGLGTLLLEHLAVAARRSGVAAFEAQTLGTNHPMQELFRQAGFGCEQRWSAGVIEVSFPIVPTQHYLERLIGRDVLAVRAWLQPRMGSSGQNGLGVVCRTAATADVVVTACMSRGVEVAALVVTEELGIDLSAGLSCLAMSDQYQVIAVDPAGLVTPRRVVALGREMARRGPVVALTPPGDPADWCDQAGVDSVPGVEELVDRIRELLIERRASTWQRTERGALVELQGCDLLRSRQLLDQVNSSRLRGNDESIPLDVGAVRDLLAFYEIATAPFAGPGCEGAMLTLEDQAGLGLVARASAAVGGPDRGLVRLLPLTDRDAEELVGVVLPNSSDVAAPVEAVLRAARLIDDQADVSRIRIRLGRSRVGSGREVGVWTGPRRGTEDDPFVRRLPPRRPADDRGPSSPPARAHNGRNNGPR